MIVPMARVHVAARTSDRERLLRALGRVGAVHMVPVDPAAAVPTERIAAQLGRVRQALQVLKGVEPGGSRPDMSATGAVRRVLALRRRIARREARLTRLHRQVERSAGWGETAPEQLDELERAGVAVELYALPAADLDAAEGDLVLPLGRPTGARTLVAIAGDPDHVSVPPSARPVPRPTVSLATIRAEAAAVERAVERDRARLARLAHLTPGIRDLRERLDEAARWSVARRSALEGESLCAFQGWVPREQAPRLAGELERNGVEAAVRWTRPAPQDEPPTFIRYPRWARPMRGLFDLLGTVPGYREADASGFFMFALPLFAGMLIGDAGYGLIFLLLPLLFHRQLIELLGADRTALLMTFGGAALLWGAATGVWFGVTPEELMATGSAAAAGLGDALYRVQLVRGTEEQMRATVIKICFVIGSTHLILAHLRRAVQIAPSGEFLAEIGWCLVLAAMVGIIWLLFFGEEGNLPAAFRPVVAGTMGAGMVLVVLFMAPDPNPLRRIGLGFAGSILPLINAFSDTLSYIRLMAVGLASHYIAAAFNTLAFSLAGVATWVAGAPLLLFGHLLNLALVLLAIFAHGVRLNMLEFSSHAGIQWTGYPYRPFAAEPAGGSGAGRAGTNDTEI
jgi:V/A-type H+/Na+-transporting ATPase subunit I